MGIPQKEIQTELNVEILFMEKILYISLSLSFCIGCFSQNIPKLSETWKGIIIIYTMFHFQ